MDAKTLKAYRKSLRGAYDQERERQVRELRATYDTATRRQVNDEKLVQNVINSGRNSYAAGNDPLGGGGVGVSGVDQLGSASPEKGRQSGAVDFRNLQRYYLTPKERQDSTWMKKQEAEMERQRKAGNITRTEIAKNPVTRGLFTGMDRFAGSLTFGATDVGSQGILSDWQAQGATNLTDEEMQKYVNSKSARIGGFAGEMAGYMVPYLLTGGAASAASKKTIAKPLANILKGEGKNVFTKAVGKISSPLIDKLATREAVKLVGKNAPKAALKAAKRQVVSQTAEKLAVELGKDLLQDVTIGNAQDYLSKRARGEEYTVRDFLINNGMNLGMGAAMDLLPGAAKALRAGRNTGNESMATLMKRYTDRGVDAARAEKMARRRLSKMSQETLQDAVNRYKGQGLSEADAYRAARRERLAPSGQAMGGQAARTEAPLPRSSGDTLQDAVNAYRDQGMSTQEAYRAARRDRLQPSGQAMGGQSGRIEAVPIRPNETLEDAVNRYRAEGYDTTTAYRMARRERLGNGSAMGGASGTRYTEDIPSRSRQFTEEQMDSLNRAYPGGTVDMNDIDTVLRGEQTASARTPKSKRNLMGKRDVRNELRRLYNQNNFPATKEVLDDLNDYVRLAREELAKKNPDMAMVDEFLDDAADYMTDEAVRIFDRNETLDILMDDLRNTTINVPEESVKFHGDGGWGDFRQKNFGRVNYRKKPAGSISSTSDIDRLWEDYFQQKYGDKLFPSNITNPADQFDHINKLVQDYYENGKGVNWSGLPDDERAALKLDMKDRLYKIAAGDEDLEPLIRNSMAEPESRIPENTDEIFDDLRRQDAANAEARERARADYEAQDSARRIQERENAEFTRQYEQNKNRVERIKKRQAAERKAVQDAEKAVQDMEKATVDPAAAREKWEKADREMRRLSTERAVEQMSDADFMRDLRSRGIDSNMIRRMSIEQGLSRQKVVDNLYQGYQASKRYAELGKPVKVGELTGIEKVAPDKIGDNDFGIVDPTSKEYQNLKANEEVRQKYSIAAESAGVKEPEPNFAMTNDPIEWDNGPTEGQLELSPEAAEALASTADAPARIMSAEEAAQLQKIRAKSKRPTWQKIKTKVFDSLQPIYDLSKQKGDRSIYVKADHWRSIKKQSNNAIDGNGIYRFVNGKHQKVSKSLSEIYKPVEELGPDAVKDFERYLYELQNTYRFKEGKGSFGKNWTDEQSLGRIKEIEQKWGKEALSKYADEMHNYTRQLLELQVDSGVLTRAHVDSLYKTNPYYMPLHRLMEGEPGYEAFIKNFQASGGFYNVSQSNLPILNPRDQLASLARGAYERSAANELGLKLFDALNDTTLYKRLGDADFDLEKEMDDMIGIEIKKQQKGADQTKGQPFSADNGFTYTIRRNGDRIMFRIPENMYRGLVDTASATPKVRGLNDFQNLFRNLVTTWNPLFAPINAMRDIGDAVLFTNYGAPKFLRNYGKAWKEMTHKGELWEMFKARTGATSDFFDIAKHVDEGKWYKKVRNATIGNVEKFNDAMEQTTRFAEWLCAIDAHGLTKEGVEIADHEAREISVNFSRGGKIVQTANANGVTFLNAGVQDLVRLKRALGDKKKLTRLIVTASILGIGPSVLNEIGYAHDEDYQNLRTTDKDKNYFIKLPGTHKFVKIPKGRVSSAFSMPVQRTTRMALGNSRNGDAFTGMGHSMFDQVGTVNPLTNNLAAPLIQAAQNRSWYGQPIESDYLVENYLPGQRTDENTTSVATKLGEKLNISPKKIDYVFKQYSGVLGQFLQPALTPGKMANDPKSFATNVLLNRFVTDAVTNNGLSTDFYERSTRAKQMTNAPNATDVDIALNEMYTKGSSQLSEYNSQVREIKGSPHLSAKEKMEQIQEINKEKNRVINLYLNNEEKFREVAEQKSKTIKRSNYESDSQYKKAIYLATSSEVLGGEETLKSMVKQDKYDQIKAAHYPASKYVKASLESQKYTSNYAKAYVAIQNGATDYEKAKLVDGNITEAQYNKVRRLKDSGLSPDQIENLTSLKTRQQIDTEERTDDRAYINTDEAKAYLNSRSDLTPAQKAALFASYCPRATYNPYE